MDRLHHVANRYLLCLICIAYLAGALFPNLGIALKHNVLGHLTWIDGSHMTLTVQALLLAILLFNAGIGVSIGELRVLSRRPWMLLLGLAANSVVPIAAIFIGTVLLTTWHDHVEVQALIAGLALVVSMPIAGSSTAWSQNSGGNMAFSLGLVLFSTMLSPITTPFLLEALAKHIPLAGSSANLGTLGTADLGAFLVYAIVLPSLCGIFIHKLLGEKLILRLKPTVKLTSIFILLFLNYANASIALPEVFHAPDWDFLALAGAVTLGLCCLLFFVGWNLPVLTGGSNAVRISMMYGLGMNNNGSALVLAAAVLPTQPLVMLPIIIYNLGQHIVGGAARKIVDAEI